MICPNCGREIPDGTICPCALEAAAPPLSDNPAVNVIKTAGSSGLGLALAVLLSLSALLAIFSSLGTSQALDNLYYYAYTAGLDMDVILRMMEYSRSSSLASAVLGSIPAILMAVAAWIHFGTCRSRASGNISTAGLTIYKVLAYIGLIGLCLAALLVVGLLGILIFAAAAGTLSLGDFAAQFGSYDADEAKLALIIIFATFAAFLAFFMALAIAYQAGLIRTINRVKAVAATGLADNRVSSYVIGMNYVLAAFSILSGLFSLFFSPLSAIASFASAGGGIVASLLLSRYRKAMNLVIFPPVMPPMPQPVYAAQPEPAAPEDGPREGEQPPQE